MTVIERCPTCGESGPDVIDRVGDYGGDTFEARCGDEWHDSDVSLRQQLQGAVSDFERVGELAEWLIRDRREFDKVTAYAGEIAALASRHGGGQ